MITANNTVTCSHPLLFNFIQWHHASIWQLVGNNSSMQPTPLWSVGKSTFLPMCIYKHCFCPCYLFLIWNAVLKYLALCLITIIAARFLHLYACLTCSSVHASSLHPLLAHHHLRYVDVYCFFSYFCDMLHFFMTPFWLICEHIFSFVLHFHSFQTLFGIWSSFDFLFFIWLCTNFLKLFVLCCLPSSFTTVTCHTHLWRFLCNWELKVASLAKPHFSIICKCYYYVIHVVAASGPTIWTSTYGLEPVLCNRLLIEPSGWEQTIHKFTQRFTYHVTQYSRRSLNAFFFSPFCACICDLAKPYLCFFRR